MAAVVFDYAAWALLFPTLAASTDVDSATGFFSMAQLTLLGNDLPGDPPSIVCNEARRLALFNLLVAHLATLEARAAAAGAAMGGGIVGNIKTASEGSVNLTLSDYTNADDKGKWYAQTAAGAAYWNAVQLYMRGFYLSGPQPYTGVGYPFAGPGGRGRFYGRR